MKLYIISAVLAISWLGCYALDYPGTERRPILSEEEASQYTAASYLNGWVPESIAIPEEPDFEVQAGESVQKVVNDAIKQSDGTRRIYIKIQPGHYMETVYINGETPLTIYGDPHNPENVHIMANISAQMSASQYQRIVNENGERYQMDDPAWDLYNSCASKMGVIGSCATVLWVNSAQFQLQGVTIHNGATDAQGIAIKTTSDKVHLKNCNFLGFQDTVGLGVDNGSQLERVFVEWCYIEGEVDYVFGSASAVMENVVFYTVAIKTNGSQIIFAPSTAPARSFRFLVLNSNITGDSYYATSHQVSLARSWDRGIASADLYIPDESPNGQLVIRESTIEDIINLEAPYSAAATSSRPFKTDIKPDRNLDDNTHNRLWEYNNMEVAKILISP
uniref:pectinesterase n=1 Tax=Dendroctonus ponderosae TaxID=77166 RepID=J3JVE7_DENPD|nr:unknown [Dendroctonus ponderosae]